MLWALRKVLAAPALQVIETAVRVPVFYGHALALQVETRDKLGIDAARALLKKAPGVKLIDARKSGAYPTPVTEAAGKDAVYVGRMPKDITLPSG